MKLPWQSSKSDTVRPSPPLSSIRIERFRGIRNGFAEFAPLTVLVGPNGSGKSTVLDALRLASGQNAAEGLGSILGRRPGAWREAAWLLPSGQPVATDGRLLLRYSLNGGPPQEFDLKFERFEANGKAPGGKVPAASYRLEGPEPTFPTGRYYRELSVGTEGETRSVCLDWRVPLPRVALLLPLHRQVSLPDAWSQVRADGRLAELHDLVAPLLGRDFRGIEVSSEAGRPVLHIVYTGRAVPLSIAGDGVATLIGLATEIISLQADAYLVEEPEIHLHTRAIWLIARQIVAAVGLGKQVILSTHSLDLIDGLLAALGPDGLPGLSLLRVSLQGGELSTLKIAGPDVAERRAEFHEDLR